MNKGTLKDALRSNEFAVTAELSMSSNLNTNDLVASAKRLSEVADAVQIPDHRSARPHIPPVAAAAHLLAAGIDPVVRINCRDRNRLATHSELLAARSFGITNILIARGADLPENHQPRTSSIYDMSAIDLVGTASAISKGEALVENSAEDAFEFFVGTVATAFSPKDDWQPDKLLAKADAGADFIQLQLCMTIDALRKYMEHLVEARLTWRFQVIANIAVLPTVEEAQTMRRNNPGSVIPAEFIKRLEGAKDPEAEGVTIAAELIQALNDISGIAGVNLQTTGGPELMVAAISESGIRASA